MQLLSVVAEAALDLLALVLPVTCSGCGAPDRSVCADCAAHLRVAVQTRRVGELVVYSAAAYDEPIAGVIRNFKDDGRIDAAPTLGRAMRHTLSVGLGEHALVSEPLIVPVPTTASAVRRRGFAPVERILQAGGVRMSRRLRVARHVRDQSELGAAARADNLAGAFIAKRSLEGRSCVLVDDVVTTGATLHEAARALTAAGAEVLFGATVAATPLRHAPKQGAAPSMSLRRAAQPGQDP